MTVSLQEQAQCSFPGVNRHAKPHLWALSTEAHHTAWNRCCQAQNDAEEEAGEHNSDRAVLNHCKHPCTGLSNSGAFARGAVSTQTDTAKQHLLEVSLAVSVTGCCLISA
jgi:hypothetical protein